ncbi:MAG TPA: NACHT domain-containing protein [Bacteroidales bacterium]|nr:NACHT domain-containing protein [Bacteroidales bacterium]
MKKLSNDLLNWFLTCDYMAIVYSLIAGIILILANRRFRLFIKLKRNLKRRKGIKKLKEEVLEECSNLIVVGRKKGFSLKDVFVELEIMVSDLSHNRSEEMDLFSSFVLVGGPGAGKSTYVKNLMYTRLISNFSNSPLFIRLKEYDNYSSIEDFFITKAEQCDIPDPKEFITNSLRKNQCLCILDGLDEVAPQARDKVYKHINVFFRKYFEKKVGRQLIVTCRKEAYRNIPLSISTIMEIRPLSNSKILEFAKKWPLKYPIEKDANKFWADLASTSKILELARSPLLLVGGLMQYTESNMGIPENRVEYLNRIAEWLTVEWARAQGHPPDKFKAVYTKILIKIAVYIHQSGKTDANTQDVLTLIAKWLPNYGFDSKQADEVLDNLYTKTGLLVRDTPGKVVFSQFSIQEYFASRDIIQYYGIEKFVKLQPESWWRESKLLAIAQQEEPETVLNSLFVINPILAAAAVAECPTSSISFQKLAIKECLRSLDNNKESVDFSSIQLLRKLSGEQELLFCKELGERLSNNKIASKVGIILASADTAEATKILAENPKIWSKCLKEASYLSPNFENLLLKWIEEGNEEQSLYAANLISLRLSEEKLNQLVSILPNLTSGRADHLAKLLLKYGTRDYKRRRIELSEDSLKIICQCVPYIKSKENYIKQYFDEENYQRVDGPIPTALILKTDFQITEPDKIYNHLKNSLIWSIKKHSIFSWISAGLILISIINYEKTFFCSLGLAALIFSVNLTLNTKRFPWSKFSYFGNMRNIPSAFILLAIGTLFFIVFFFDSQGEILLPKYKILLTTLLSLSFILYGISEYNNKIERYYLEIDLNIEHIKIIAIIYGIFSASLGVLSVFYPYYLRECLFVIGILFFAWNVFLMTRYIIPWMKVKKATKMIQH